MTVIFSEYALSVFSRGQQILPPFGLAPHRRKEGNVPGVSDVLSTHVRFPLSPRTGNGGTLGWGVVPSLRPTLRFGLKAFQKSNPCKNDLPKVCSSRRWLWHLVTPPPLCPSHFRGGVGFLLLMTTFKKVSCGAWKPSQVKSHYRSLFCCLSPPSPLRASFLSLSPVTLWVSAAEGLWAGACDVALSSGKPSRGQGGL